MAIGSGRSCLLSNWSYRYEPRLSDDVLVGHPDPAGGDHRVVHGRVRTGSCIGFPPIISVHKSLASILALRHNLLTLNRFVRWMK